MDKFQIVKDLLESNRSIRRFVNSKKISTHTLKDIVNLSRFCASGRNIQPLRYRIVSSEDECDRLFPLLAWAGYYKDWSGPSESERPVAYLVQCLDTEIASNCLCDDGLQIEAITLGAKAVGISSCIIKAFNTAKVTDSFQLAPNLQPRYIIALGYASEKAEIVELASDGNIEYFRDKNGIQCVPKRPLQDILID